MSVYVMSDIHGDYNAFSKMLNLIDFSIKDDLYIIGDVIDRGLSGIKIIQEIMNVSNIHMLMGNHEDMMITYYTTLSKFDKTLWFRNGGEVTYNTFESLSRQEQIKIFDWLRKLPVKKKVFVNGNNYTLGHACPWGKEKDEVLWERIAPEYNTPKEGFFVCGHTPTILLSGNSDIFKSVDERTYFIDCGTTFGYKLGCLRLNDMKEFYVDSKRGDI